MAKLSEGIYTGVLVKFLVWNWNFIDSLLFSKEEILKSVHFEFKRCYIFLNS
jgi:hypothetical protein